MREIHVSLPFKVVPERVFAALADHETFFQGRQLSCRLLREGSPDRNGNGALREVRSGRLVFVEDISDFQPAQGFDYRVQSLCTASGRRLPFHHHRGWLSLMPEAGGTRVHWRSRFSIAVPLLGRLIEPLVARSVAHAFELLLLRARERLEGPETAAMAAAENS